MKKNCAYVEAVSPTYSSQTECLRASEKEILSLEEVDFPIILADCKPQHTNIAVAESDVKDLMEHELHEPALTDAEVKQIAATDTRKNPIANALGTIKNASVSAVNKVLGRNKSKQKVSPIDSKYYLAMNTK